MSLPMAGMSGEKMKRDTNVKKNSRVTTITVPTTARNGIGVGHALAMREWYQVPLVVPPRLNHSWLSGRERQAATG